MNLHVHEIGTFAVIKSSMKKSVDGIGSTGSMLETSYSTSCAWGTAAHSTSYTDALTAVAPMAEVTEGIMSYNMLSAKPTVVNWS